MINLGELAAMVPLFDIFKRQGGGSVRWLGIATDLEAAKLRVKELTESAPGEYFIFSLAAGHRLTVTLDDADEHPVGQDADGGNNRRSPHMM
jgi:hypothetical protein